MKYRYTWTHSDRNLRTRYYRSELAARSAIARHIGWFELGLSPAGNRNCSIAKGAQWTLTHGPYGSPFG